MATSTLLQKLDPASAGFGATTSNRRQVETFIAGETLAVGDWVAFDYGAAADGDVTVVVFKADANSTPVRTPFGVVLKSVAPGGTLTAGSTVEVVISGVCNALFQANASGTDYPLGTLIQIGNNAGEGIVASAASAQPVCGILAQVQPNGASAQVRRVVVIKQF